MMVRGDDATMIDNILKNIEANVIDSCIEVIIGFPIFALIGWYIANLHTLIVPTLLT